MTDVDQDHATRRQDHKAKLNWAVAQREHLRPWYELTPKEAVERNIAFPNLEFWGPIADGEEDLIECPWPWEPQQLVGAPLGQYHCGYCGTMVVAGVPHFDHRPAPVSGHGGDSINWYEGLACYSCDSRDTFRTPAGVPSCRHCGAVDQ